MYPSNALPGCTQPVEADQPSSECDVAWGTYGDQELQATYTSSPSSELEGQITVPETLRVQIKAPVDLGAGNTYSAYDNAGPSAIGDCSMAAAADWIETTFGTTPSDQEIVSDYWAAEGEFNDGADVGLTPDYLFDYWQADGIGGTTLTGVDAISAADVKSELSERYVLLSQVTLPSGYPLGDGEGASHFWIVVGYSDYGPMVVTWGQEVQISWADFDDWTTGIWGIGASQS